MLKRLLRLGEGMEVKIHTRILKVGSEQEMFVRVIIHQDDRNALTLAHYCPPTKNCAKLPQISS